jgi:hypothetical protein
MDEITLESKLFDSKIHNQPVNLPKLKSFLAEMIPDECRQEIWKPPATTFFSIKVDQIADGLDTPVWANRSNPKANTSARRGSARFFSSLCAARFSSLQSGVWFRTSFFSRDIDPTPPQATPRRHPHPACSVITAVFPGPKTRYLLPPAKSPTQYPSLLAPFRPRQDYYPSLILLLWCTY